MENLDVDSNIVLSDYEFIKNDILDLVSEIELSLSNSKEEALDQMSYHCNLIYEETQIAYNTMLESQKFMFASLVVLIVLVSVLIVSVFLSKFD